MTKPTISLDQCISRSTRNNKDLYDIKHDRSQDLIDYAYRTAEEAHKGQLRKYTFDPYIIHPLAVAKIVQSVTDDANWICAALLHDVVEDCDLTIEDIDQMFAFPISNLVLGMTEFTIKTDGNRKFRKELDRRYLGRQSSGVHTIKLADLIHNSESIIEHGKGFASTYISEMELLLEVLTKGDERLMIRAKRICSNYRERKDEL